MKKFIQKAIVTGVTAASLLPTASVFAQDPVKIQYWHPNADTQGGQTVIELVENFNASQDEVEVEQIYNSGMYQGIMQNLQTAAATGQVPALVQIGWSYREYFENNFGFVEPQEIIDNFYADDKDFIKGKFADNIYNLATANSGRQVGLPYSLSVPVLYLNMDILNEAGVDPESLTTWEAVREAAKQITEKTDYEGLYIAEAADNWNVQALVESNGSKVITDGQASFADEQGQATYQFYQDMVKEGSALHVPNDQGQQAFVSGEVGMAHMTIAQRTNVTSNGDFEALAVPSPAFEGQEANLPAGGSMLVVTAQEPEQQEAVWKFVKYLYEPDNIAAWTAGTGYVPATQDATENADLEKLLNEDPIFSAANSSLEHMVPWAPFPGKSGLEAEQLLIDLRDKVLEGADVAKEVPAAQEEINKLIKE
ncbi:ABC transporter substrate-binding protein [Hutsoniella sourekii]|uniref:ABC transporter substrate-binding protein n=1 Tax=Hutsoniella sourekii TaxID=87650 RepID=UPI0004AF0614|nr:ABC transporter substrate-binding protein [Hutsoniella sourekii]